MTNSKKILFTTLSIVLSLFILQGCSSLLVDYSRWKERSQTCVSEKSVQVGDNKIFYLEGGRGETVILLHGFGDNKDSWVRFARSLTPKYHVIIPDLPGFGKSTKNMNARYDIMSQVVRLHDFADTLGIKQFHVAGNSMGGTISGIYAVTYPDQMLSLGLIDPGGITDREPSDLFKELTRGVNPLIVETPADFDRLLDFIFVSPPSIPGPVKKYLAEQAVASRDFNKKVFVEATPGSQLEARFKDIKAKTLVIWGDADRIFPASSAKVIEQGIKNSRVIVIKDCGHLPMVEKAEESAKYYLEFISKS